MFIFHQLFIVVVSFANDAWDVCRNANGMVNINIYQDYFLTFPINGTNDTGVPFSSGLSCSVTLNPAPLTILDVYFSGQNFTNNTMTALYENNATQGITLSGDPKNQRITPSAVPYLVRISPMQGEPNGTFTMQVDGIKVNSSANMLTVNSSMPLLVSTNEYMDESLTFIASGGFKIALFVNFMGDEQDEIKIENLLRYNIFFSQNAFLTTSGHIYKLNNGVYPTEQQSVTMHSVFTRDNNADIIAFAYRDSGTYWKGYNCSIWKNKVFSLQSVDTDGGFSALILIMQNITDGRLSNITWISNTSSILDVYEEIPELSTTTSNGNLVKTFYSNSSTEQISPLRLPKEMYTFVARGGKVDISLTQASFYRSTVLSIACSLLIDNTLLSLRIF